MSLRTRLLAAFAYVLVLVIVALEVPLALNLSRRVDAEIRSEAQGQAQLLAASAVGRLDNPEELDRLVNDAEEDLGGRVIVVGPRGRLLADSVGPDLLGTLVRVAPGDRRRAARPAGAGRAPQRRRSARTCSSPPCPW